MCMIGIYSVQIDALTEKALVAVYCIFHMSLSICMFLETKKNSFCNIILFSVYL